MLLFASCNNNSNNNGNGNNHNSNNSNRKNYKILKSYPYVKLKILKRIKSKENTFAYVDAFLSSLLKVLI